MTTTSRIKLDKSYNPFWMRLNKSHNLTMPRIDLGTDLDVKPVYNPAKSLTKISNKVYEPKTYDEAINNLIYKNRWCKTIDKEL